MPLSQGRSCHENLRGRLTAALLALPWLPRVAAAGGSVEAVTAAGLRAALDAARGHVIVLNLWGTWCTPCLREIPGLVLLERELGERGMLLIGVAMDDASELETDSPAVSRARGTAALSVRAAFG